MRPCPKPEPRRAAKARRTRAEGVVKRDVRAACASRDGGCRLWRRFITPPMGACEGPSEWAHFGAKRRARTVGQPSELRHTTDGSLMLCRRHHHQYDQRILDIEPATERGADGPLVFTHRASGFRYKEE